MELLSVSVECYKRFKSKTSLQTNGKLIALLGPNEAGKSSLLTAISHLGHAGAVSAAELSRDVDPEKFRIIGRFFLDETELKASGLNGPHSMLVHKYADGQRKFSFEPAAPRRDISHRASLVQAIQRVVQLDGIGSRLSYYDPELPSQFEELAEKLATSDDSLASSSIAELTRLTNAANDALTSPSSTESTLLALLSESLRLEQAPTPVQVAIKALQTRIPPFLVFDEAARGLASTYEISSLRAEIPPALSNLAEVAGLDFNELFAAIDAGLTSKITTLERRASDTLGKKFKEAWKQSGIEVAIRIQDDVLEVQIVNANSEFTAFEERSDGLRQFVALQMFATRNHVDKPILLIDEADQRLHYDAQADLVQMLARQQLAPKVIFTTHSAGCLPEDLGNGVRTIVQSAADGSSKIINRFWSEPGHGLTPLLFGLGASTLAFFPTRRAIMVEGPSDMLLFPTLFREALERVSLGFQFVPGLSENKGALEPQALATGANVFHIIDGDEGGKGIRNRLLDDGVATEHIFVLKNRTGTALELEDFISETRLLAAANEILEKWHPEAARIETLQSEEGTRLGTLERLFLERAGRKLPKVDLAYNLLDMVNLNPSLKLLDPRRSSTIADLAQKVEAEFAKIDAAKAT